MTTWAVVLAAGAGRRFGGAKLLAPFRGRPLLAHSLETARRAIAERVLGGAIVVHREGDTQTVAMVESAGLLPVPVRAEPPGLRASLAAGLGALGATREPLEVTGALILPADQPLVRHETIRSIVREAEAGAAAVVRPIYQGEPETPGHPVWLARTLWPLVSALGPDEGFGRLVAERGLSVRLVPIPGDNPDVDTLDALATLERSRET